MRKLKGLVPIFFLFLCFIAAVPVALAQIDSDYFYYADGNKIHLPPSKERVAVRFKQVVAPSAITKKLGVDPVLSKLSVLKTISPSNLTILESKQEKLELQLLKQMLKRLMELDDVETAYPVFEFADADLIATDELVVKLKQGYDIADLKNLNKIYDTKIVKKNKWLDRTYILKIKPNTLFNVIDMANSYNQNAVVEFSQPNFIRYLKEFAVPNDTLFADQWSLDNIGQSGWPVDADIDAPEAWDLAGQGEVIIAIIDEGVDVDHVDLAAKMIAGYDATNEAPPGGIPGNANIDDGHGTACAGIAAAVSNNGDGIAGVSWSAKIMPVRVAIGSGSAWITTDEWLADGILWAANNGADVLSNSWGGGPDSTLVHNAIIAAGENGRNGLGSVVVFASGNDNLAVSWPAKYEEVIAVGATSPCDERKNTSSCDGENWWGSNYGPELDVVAPGVKITTTDIMGAGGYTSGNYIDYFNGTSSATPHVAGLAALILSADSRLTAEQVKSAIYNSADDGVGSPSEDTPGWDQFMGWGRINAYEALYSLCPEDGRIELDRTAYGPGSEITVDVWDRHLNSNPAQIEQYSDVVTLSTSEGDLETVIVLSENDLNSCHFTGTISIARAAISPEDGAVQIACSPDEVMTAQYSDADDGTGNPATIFVFADTDCEPPVISSVSGSSGYFDATISWNTDEPADSKVLYGTNLPLSTTTSNKVFVTDHGEFLDGLSPATTYYYAVESMDAAGNTTVDDNNGQYYQFNTQAPVTYYVPDDYPTIQSAIDAIPSYSENEIIVRAGTYTENIDTLDKDFQLRSESGPDVTILDGGNAGSVVTFLGYPEPIYGQLIEGFTITNGNTSAGGGIYAVGVSPRIVNCKITGNTATIKGGGIYNPYFSPEIIDSEITDNSAGEVGGGIYFAHLPSSPSISNTIITGNTAGENGGGIYGDDLESINIDGSTISFNTASNGGGLYLNHPPYLQNTVSVTLTNSSITHNVATGGANTYNNGGGLFVYDPSPLTISNCSISHNVADRDGYGGGIAIMSGSSVTISNSTFDDNMAQNGGAIKNSYSNLIMSNSKITNNSANGAGGGINLEGDRSHTLINCLISNNSAQGQGGGILASSAEATILNSTFSNNSAALDYGGGIYGDRDLNIVNSIFWGDTANGNPDEIYLTQSGYAHFTYSDIQGGWSGTGNIDVDPLFAGGGDYHLADGSPCIDAGTDDSVTYPSLPVNDMDGNSRPEGLGYDMGAYEYFCTDPDTDGDGVADCFDPCPLDNPDDSDDDGICASDDNCPGIANPNQIDGDSDGTGDACDSCPNDAANDLDADDVCGDVDNCPAVANPAQDDTDGDFIGDACDLDIDGDGLTNLEEYELGTDPMLTDTDGDGVEDGFDGYPLDDTASECPVLVRCYETSEPYASLQDAFDDSLIVAGDTIQCTASNLTDALRFEQDKEIFLQGGFFCGYTDNPSYSTINGSLTINNGTVRVERIIIQ